MAAGLLTLSKAAAFTALAITATLFSPARTMAEEPPAKQIFGAARQPTTGASTPYGSYAKGCQAGAVAMPANGPQWQAMRLSRNRLWGQPQMVALLQKLARDAPAIGWPGLLLGDIAQPRGGPMLSGHASHQIGLDADIWFTPMPDHILTAAERETLPFTSLLDKSRFLTVDPRAWTPTHAKLLMLAAGYPEVDRIFVNPAIKQKLCESWSGERAFMGKIRPFYGHDSHFHIRLKCPPGASSCKPQAPVAEGDGCDKTLAWWFTKEPWTAPKIAPAKPRPVTLADLPAACAAIAAAPPSGSPTAGAQGADTPSVSSLTEAGKIVPVPVNRPVSN